MTFPALTVADSPLLHDATAFAARCDENATDYTVMIGLPMTWRLDPRRPRRILYVLDGDILFASALQTLRLMSADITASPIEEFIVVGIGWADVGGLPVYPFQRLTDFSPEGAKLPPFFAGRVPAGLTMGGGPVFRRFLETQVDPWVRAHYPVRDEPGVLWGYSYGGYFALDTVLSGSALSSDYIIGSPGIIFEDDVLFATEAALADGALHGRVFLSVGDLEDHSANAAYRAISLNGRRMGHRLRRHAGPGFAIEQATLIGESHHSGTVRSLTTGLRALAAMTQL